MLHTKLVSIVSEILTIALLKSILGPVTYLWNLLCNIGKSPPSIILVKFGKNHFSSLAADTF